MGPVDVNSRLIFHIGLHKTATTSLQVDAFPNINSLNYLSLSNQVVRDYIDHLLACDPIYYSSSTKASPLRASLDDKQINLISCEALSGPAWVGVSQRGIDHRAPVLQNLAHDFPDAEIIIILRRQDGYARSMYRQYVKSGGTQDMASFLGLRDPAVAPLFSTDRFKYAPLVRYLKRHFDGGVHVMFFEDFQKDGEMFMQQLANILGCPPIPVPGRRNSTRLGSTGLQVSRQLNRIFRGLLNPGAPIPGIPIRRNGSWRWENPVAILQDHWPGKKPVQSATDKQLSERILATCRSDNEALGELIGRDLSELGY